jgi:hypothetical protein
MNQKQLISFYDERRTKFIALLEAVNAKINIISNARIITALIFIVLVYLAFSEIYLSFLAFVFVIIFAVLVQRHSKLFEEKVHFENLKKVNTWEMQALMGDLSSFASGSEFVDTLHPYAHDLDIFGESSLFQSINRANTIDGKNEMAKLLLSPLDTTEEILARQNAARELTADVDFRQHLQAAGLEIKEQKHDRAQLLEWLRQPAILYSKPYVKAVLIIVPILTVSCVFATFFVSTVKPLAILLALGQWAVLGFYIKRVNAFHEYISQKKSILEKYAHILHFLQGGEFTSPLLRDITVQATKADIRIKSLASRVSAFNARLNAMMNLVVNSLLMYDLQCVYSLEEWKSKNSANLKLWLDVISRSEVLSSMGTFSFNHPSFTYPTIEESLTIEAHDLGHPLIPEDENISNDVSIGNSQTIIIITGANMAGKSTFLRSLGVNLVLALSGAVVCARSFHCPVINIRTGMRTADSLKEHQSYFYAELNRLKAIMEDLRSDKPLVILLDEILKGTNSRDKQLGSIALVKQLIPHPCLAVIATHDLALGELERDYSNKIKNFCFEATIENDKLSFDYKLRPGVAQQMNATYLMEKMGIIPSGKL